MVFEKRIETINNSINTSDLKEKAKIEYCKKKERKEDLDSFTEKYIRKYKYMPVERISKVRLDLEPKRENELNKINIVYNKEVFSNNKRIGRTRLIKIAIDNLINDLEKQASEEEAIEYLRTLYKEAEF